MARIAGVELQDNWKIEFALTRIKGIGWSLAKKTLKGLNINSRKKISELTPQEVSDISSKIDGYEIEGDLLRNVTSNIQRLKIISSYRGIRHSKGLPVRGQRTRTNARTKRGKRKTVGAFKKEELTKRQAVEVKGGKIQK